jgi:hypothetical protein
MAPSKTRSHFFRLLAMAPAPIGADTQSRSQLPRTAPLDPLIKSLPGQISHNSPQLFNLLILLAFCLQEGWSKVGRSWRGLGGSVPNFYTLSSPVFALPLGEDAQWTSSPGRQR